MVPQWRQMLPDATLKSFFVKKNYNRYGQAFYPPQKVVVLYSSPDTRMIRDSGKIAKWLCHMADGTCGKIKQIAIHLKKFTYIFVRFGKHFRRQTLDWSATELFVTDQQRQHDQHIRSYEVVHTIDAIVVVSYTQKLESILW
uniref:Uncharacterized protein n=1 Tax=Romanomermis culicivorax TaxID=13658 RepID=A0A915KZ15_ROMCU